MKAIMDFERITSPLHPMYGKVRELYQQSFPFHEQREEASQAAILRYGDYHLEIIRDEERFLGLAGYWEGPGYIYIEHFCIQPEMRGMHHGEKALSLLKEGGRTLILEIDPPVDAVSIRRKGFYERCGFKENPYRHIHPPYHRGYSGHELMVMSSPCPIPQAMYDAFSSQLRDRIMDHAFA